MLQSKQIYDSSGNPLSGQFDACAGNGCFTRGDDTIVAACGRSLRILGMSSESPLSAIDLGELRELQSRLRQHALSVERQRPLRRK